MLAPVMLLKSKRTNENAPITAANAANTTDDMFRMEPVSSKSKVPLNQTVIIMKFNLKYLLLFMCENQ